MVTRCSDPGICSTLRIYLRRSKADEGHQQFSLDTQRAGCERFVDSELVRRLEGTRFVWSNRCEYVDDDRAGDDFLGRADFLRLLKEASSGDIVLCRDQSRLGRDALEVTLAIRKLVQEKGARLFYYANGQEVFLANAMDAATVFIGGVGHQMELEAIRSRTREALRACARAGRIAGGRCYGYDLERMTDGLGRKYTVAKVNPHEAEIVRRIYSDCLAGRGLKRIAIALNSEGIPSPRAGRRGTGSWAPAYVRTILVNPRYRGVYVHGRVQRVRRGGKRLTVRAPATDVIRVEIPDWRIVDDITWANAQEALRARAGNIKAPGPAAKYALSGIGKCGHCGGSIGIVHTKRGQHTIHAYACTWHHNRGNVVCPVTIRQPRTAVDRAMADYVQRLIQAPETLREFLVQVRAEIRAQVEGSKGDRAPLEAELRGLRAEQKNLAKAVAAGGGDLPEIIEEMRDRKARIAKIEAHLAVASRTPALVDETITQVEALVLAKLRSLHEALSQDPAGAREVYRGLFPDGLTFTPATEDPRRWRISGAARLEPCKLGSDPNGILSVGNQVSKVLTLLPALPPIRIVA